MSWSDLGELRVRALALSGCSFFFSFTPSFFEGESEREPLLFTRPSSSQAVWRFLPGVEVVLERENKLGMEEGQERPGEAKRTTTLWVESRKKSSHTRTRQKL